MNFSCLSVSRELVRQVALNVDQYVLTKRRWGRRAADTELGARGAGVVTTRPLERVEIDNTLCDVHLVDEKTGRPIGRPWLTLLVDHYSGAVLGYHLSLDPPSSTSVIAALRHAILPKSGVWSVERGTAPKEGHVHDDLGASDGTRSVSGAGLGAESSKAYLWLTHGIPELLVSDNGKDFGSRHIRDLAVRLAMSLQFAPVLSPWFKSGVERAFGTFNTRLFHRMPGTTLGKPLSRFGYDGARAGKVTECEFREVLDQYIVTVHNPHPRRTKGHSANELFIQGIQRYPARMPSSVADLTALFSRTEYRVIRQTGIQYLYLQYQSSELATLFHTVKRSTRLACSIDMTDLRAIRVVHPISGEAITARCVRDLGSQPYSHSRYLAKLGLMKQLGLDPESDGDLAQAELKLTRMIAAMSNKRSNADVRKEMAAFKRMQRLGQQGLPQADEVGGIPDKADRPTVEVISSTQDVEDKLAQVFSQSL